jgi:hypothetical protein
MKKPARPFFTASARLACVLLTATALLLAPNAYSQSPNPLYQHLSPSAKHIYSIRIGQIVAKGELAGLLSSIPNKDPKAAKIFNILQDPATGGVDLDHEILITQEPASGNGADTISFTQILVRLTDSAKFRRAFMTNEHIHRVPGKAATVSSGKQGLAWNDQLWVATIISTEKPAPGTGHKPAPGVRKPLSELALEKSLATLAGYPANPLLTDQRFLTAFASDEDMHAWTPKADFMFIFRKLIKKMNVKDGSKHANPFSDNANLDQSSHPPVLTTFNFENGRMVFRMTRYNSPEDAASYQRATEGMFNKDLLARVPGGLLLGYSILHFNSAALPDLLEKHHLLHHLDSSLAKQGLSVSDISAVFGGDILIAVLGDTTAITDTTKKTINPYFVATLGDPAKMMQVAARLAAASNITDTAKAAKMKKMVDKMVIRDNMLVISSSKEMAQKYFDNTTRRPIDLPDGKSGQYLKIDLKAVSAFAAATMSNNPKAMLAARVFEKLDKIEMTSGLSESGNTIVTFQIVTGDPSTNSLKTLVSLLH